MTLCGSRGWTGWRRKQQTGRLFSWGFRKERGGGDGERTGLASTAALWCVGDGLRVLGKAVWATKLSGDAHASSAGEAVGRCIGSKRAKHGAAELDARK